MEAQGPGNIHPNIRRVRRRTHRTALQRPSEKESITEEILVIILTGLDLGIAEASPRQS
jgi:hypothetical protein